MLRMILEDAAENPIQDENTYKALIVQITTLEKLMNKYQVCDCVCNLIVNPVRLCFYVSDCDKNAFSF